MIRDRTIGMISFGSRRSVLRELFQRRSVRRRSAARSGWPAGSAAHGCRCRAAARQWLRPGGGLCGSSRLRDDGSPGRAPGLTPSGPSRTGRDDGAGRSNCPADDPLELFNANHHEETDMTTPEHQLADIYVEMNNTHNPDLVDRFLAEDYINRNDFVADGREANRQWWTVFFTGLPEVSELNLMQMFQQIGALPPLNGLEV